MPNLDSYRTILAGSVVFKGLTAPDLDAVLSAAELLPRKPKDLILSEGSPTDGLYVVLEGEVEVFLPERAGSGAHRPSRIRLNRLGPGRCLGIVYANLLRYLVSRLRSKDKELDIFLLDEK